MSELTRAQVEEKLGDIASLSKFPPCKSLLDHDAALRAKVERYKKGYEDQVALKDRYEAGYRETIAQLQAQLATLTAELDMFKAQVFKQYDKEEALTAERDRLREALDAAAQRISLLIDRLRGEGGGVGCST